MIWTDRQGLAVLRASGDTAGDAQDYAQSISARIAISKFVSSLFGGEGIYSGGSVNIDNFQNSGKTFPPCVIAINADKDAAITRGPILSVSVNSGGTGYSVGDILTISGGHYNATLEVLTAPAGVVGSVEILTKGSAYSVAAGYATSVSPPGGTTCTIDVDTIDGETWIFATLSPKSINFASTNAAANSGVLYAQIKQIPGISPIAASGNSEEFTLIAQSNAVSAPINSIVLGTGTISNSSFTTWTPSEHIFVDITPQSTKYWTADTNSGSTQIDEQETFYIYGSNGVYTEVSGNSDQISIKMNLSENSGLQFVSDELSVLLKSDGGIGVDSTGLFVANSALKFVLSANSGSDETIIDKETMSINGTAPLSTATAATDQITISLSLSSTGGLETTSDDKLTLKLTPSGKLSKDSDGLYSQNVSFSISGDDNANNVIQLFSSGQTFVFQGTNAVYTDNTSGDSGKVEVGLYLAQNSGLTDAGSALSVLVDSSPGAGNEALTLDANGLSLASSILNSTYGEPTSAAHTTSELYHDKSGGLFICDSGGTPGTWSQLTIGTTFETYDDDPSLDYVLPADADFNGAARQVGYRVKWRSRFSYKNVQYDTLPWIWFNETANNIDYWVSESKFPVQFGKAYLEGGTFDSNPVSVNEGSLTGITTIIVANVMSITGEAFYYSYLKNTFDALLFENIYVVSEEDTNVSFNYTHDVLNLAHDIGNIAIASGEGVYNYDRALKYFDGEDGFDYSYDLNDKKVLVANFDLFSTEYSHYEMTAYCRYASDSDNVITTSP